MLDADLRQLLKTENERELERENRRLKDQVEMLQAENVRLHESIQARDQEVLFWREKVSRGRDVHERNRDTFNYLMYNKQILENEIEELKEKKQEMEDEGKKKDEGHVKEKQELLKDLADERTENADLTLKARELEMLLSVKSQGLHGLQESLHQVRMESEETAELVARMDATISFQNEEMWKQWKEFDEICQKKDYELKTVKAEARNFHDAKERLEEELRRRTVYWENTLRHSRDTHKTENACIVKSFKEMYKNGDKFKYRKMMKKITKGH